MTIQAYEAKAHVISAFLRRILTPMFGSHHMGELIFPGATPLHSILRTVERLAPGVIYRQAPFPDVTGHIGYPKGTLPAWNVLIYRCCAICSQAGLGAAITITRIKMVTPGVEAREVPLRGPLPLLFGR